MTDDTARPTLTSQADVQSFWTRTCRPLGWRRRELWVVLLDMDGRPFPVIQQVTGLPAAPDAVAIDNLLVACRCFLDDVDPEGRAATLLCRPGSAVVTSEDRAWAGALTSAARAAEVPLEVVHVATDDAIVPLPLDEVA